MSNDRRYFRHVAALLILGAWLIATPPAWAGVHLDQHDERALAVDPRLAEGQIAPALVGLGRNHFRITGNSHAAQRFFDQGLLLTYGFNHQEALRAFKEAARLDPDAAMPYWGWALVLGPNLNLAMSAEVVPQAYEAIQAALERAPEATARERALIEALAQRYTDDPEVDRGALNEAYAEAMARVHTDFPGDNDVATLYAASLMNVSPWNYWTGDGRPHPATETIAKVLAQVIDSDPHHEGALHYYIHLVESTDPRSGERAADLLRDLAPSAGHLVHMPSHIYMQVGRYAEAYDVNVLASRADEDYITQCRAQGVYPLTYYPHNVHFLVWAGLMEGRSAEAMEAARKVAAHVPHDMHDNHWALYQTFLSMPISVMVRFGMWSEILAEPLPDEHLLFWRGISHYARGMAYLHTEREEQAREELERVRKIADDPAAVEDLHGFENAATLLTIAREVLSGELATREGRHERALSHLERAVRLQDGMLYNEPPAWPFPIRHTLGAALLDAGRPREAEIVYNQDLKKNPRNGYALYGLWQALTAQQRHEEAREVFAAYEQAWQRADIRLRSSRF